MTARVQTEHVRAMLTEAIALAGRAEQMDPVRVETHQILERAENLATHAGAELRDEMLRARDGWAQT